MWDYINISTEYEKMILAKEGNKLNENDRNSFIFIEMYENPIWSQDYKELSISRGVENIYNYTHPHLSIEKGYDLGKGYKIFVPKITKFNTNYDYARLSKIIIQKKEEENGIKIHVYDNIYNQENLSNQNEEEKNIEQ